MRVFTFVAMFFLLLGCATAAEPAAAGRGLPARERIDRGVVARPVDGGKVYVGWRLLGSDPAGIAFNVYRRTGSAAPVKLNAEPIRQTTDFVDAQAAAGSEHAWFVRAVAAGREGPASPEAAATPTEKALPYISLKLDGNHTFQKVGIADLDGDGRYDFVIKQPHDNIDPYEKYWKRSPGTYKLEAYRHDGRFLWRVDLGWAIEQGIWYSPYVVYDLDGDGKAEVAVKTGEGDPRDADGRVQTGPEYLTILDGLTGSPVTRVDWPSREGFGDGLRGYNHACRNQLCVAYLDGKTPSLIVERGTYDIIKLVAYQLQDKKLQEVWRWDNSQEPKSYWGQGAHWMHAADVDGDGCDEVVIGSAVIDHNGKALWSTGLGHPDHSYVGKIDPSRPGLQIYYGIETRQKANGMCLVDAATGKILWGFDQPTRHVHSQGLCSDIDPAHPGCECYSADTDEKKEFKFGLLWDCRGQVISRENLCGFGPRTAYWDADPQRELVYKDRIWKYQGPTLAPAIEGQLVAVADVLGDWREEIITSLPGELRIYTTIIPAVDRRVCLMQDPIYRMDVVCAAMGYYQVPMTSYDLATGRPEPAAAGPPAGR
jgi:rhamnogalacturonan endolyase